MGIRDIYRNGGTPISDAIDRFYQARDRAKTQKLMPEAMSGSPAAMNQLMAVNPQAGMMVQNQLMAQQQQAQQAEQQKFQQESQKKQLQMEDMQLRLKAAEMGGSIDDQGNFVPGQAGAAKPMVLKEGDQLIDPTTFKVLATNEKDVDPAEALNQAGNLRKEFTGQSTLFKVQDDAYGRIVASAQKPSAAGDLALITSYMKVLDPTSSVREGEFATAQNSGSVPQKIIALQNQVWSGQRLTPEQRADFVSKAKDLYRDAADKQLKVNDRYTKLATRYGFSPEDVVENYVNYREESLKAINDAQKKPDVSGAKFLGFE